MKWFFSLINFVTLSYCYDFFCKTCFKLYDVLGENKIQLLETMLWWVTLRETHT